MKDIQLLSNLDSGRLLIFLGFGITLLTFSIKSKVSLSTPSNNGNDKQNNVIQRYADIYRFVKTIYNWGLCYFVAAIFILFSTQKYDNANINIILFNLGYFITLYLTIFLTLVYASQVLLNLLSDKIIGHTHNLDD
jgi:hypothetical protein